MHEAGAQQSVITAHLALAYFAQTDGIEIAYTYVTDRQALHARIQQCLADGDSIALASAAALEAIVYSDAFPAAVHRLTANALAGNLTDTVLPESVSAMAGVEDRNRAAAEIAALIQGHPEHATALSRILQAALTPALP
jgi:hypothetical protein